MSSRISAVEVRKNRDDRVSPILESTIEEVLVLIRAMFPVSTVQAHAREKRARELVQRALLTFDNVFTESAAIESVGSFKIPAAIMEADEELFRIAIVASLNLPECVKLNYEVLGCLKIQCGSTLVQIIRSMSV
jgi:hypothetical protein